MTRVLLITTLLSACSTSEVSEFTGKDGVVLRLDCTGRCELQLVTAEEVLKSKSTDGTVK